MQPSTIRHTFFALAGVSLTIALSACGGGDGSPGGGTPQATAQQCATNGNCSPSGPTVNAPTAAICPSTLDYNTTYTGGSGAGELLKIQLDSTQGTYRIQILESAVPKAVGAVSPTRAGVTLTGTMTHPTKPLPTTAQNNCAYELKTVTASDGVSQAIIDAANPPILFVGNGVVGGGVPGATIRFDGIFGLGVIPAKTFPIYPTIAFAETESDFSKIAGNYNVLGYHLVPSGGSLVPAQTYAPASYGGVETLNANGSCTGASSTACKTTGTPWKARADGTGFDSGNAESIGGGQYPAFYSQTMTTSGSLAHGVLVAGKLEGKLVPVVIRVGYAVVDLTTFNINVDDESGIALLAPTVTATPAALKGGYIGSGSDFKYTASSLHDNVGAWLNPQDATLTPTGAFQMDFTQATKPGVVATVDNSGQAGSIISTGPVYAHLFGPDSNPTFRVNAVASR